MKLYYGLPSAVQHHWMARMKALDPARRQASRLVVPDARLAEALCHYLPEAPPVVVLDRWLDQVLPQHITVAPQGTWEFLSTLVPDSLVSPRDRQTPGFLLSVAEVVRAGRSAGLTQVGVSADDRLPWADIWTWFDDQFRLSMADTLRVYEYAASSHKVPQESSGITFVYGFSALKEPLVGLLSAWSRRGPVEVWGLDGLVDEALLAHGDSIIHLQDVHSEGQHIQVRLDPGTDPLDVAIRLLGESHRGKSERIFVESSTFPILAWARALVRAGLVEESVVLHDREAALWKLFLQVLQTEARSAVWRRWEEMAGPLATVQWVADWRSRLLSIRTWHEMGSLIEEAAHVHQTDWDEVCRWADSVTVWDAVAAPNPIRVQASLRTLGERSREFSGVEVLPLDLAVWVPASQAVLVGTLIRRSRRTSFHRDRAIRSWIGTVDPAWLDRRVLSVWLNDHGITQWLVADALPREAVGIPWEVRETPLVEQQSVMAGRHESSEQLQRIKSWYLAWRSRAHYSSYTGQVDPQVVSHLEPDYLSPSALEDFGRCPLAFLMRRLLHIGESEGESMEVSPLLAGQWAHRALELMARRRLTLTLAHVQISVQEAMNQEPAPSTVPAFYLTYQEDRLSSELFEALVRDGWHPNLKTEVELSLSWQWLWPMQGRVDRVDWLDDGQMRLVDYKTGRTVNPAPAKPANLQLLLYQHVLSEQYQRPVSAELYGISQKAQFQHRRLMPEEAERQWPMVTEIAEGMQQRMNQGQYFPVPDAHLQPCRMCAYQLVCPDRVVEYAQMKHADHPEYVSLWRANQEDIDDTSR